MTLQLKFSFRMAWELVRLPLSGAIINLKIIVIGKIITRDVLQANCKRVERVPNINFIEDQRVTLNF